MIATVIIIANIALVVIAMLNVARRTTIVIRIAIINQSIRGLTTIRIVIRVVTATFH